MVDRGLNGTRQHKRGLKLFVKFLLSLFLMLAVSSAQAAVPSYTVFRGTGGIFVTTNPPTGLIVIDGSGVFTSSGTNATLATSTNGVLIAVASTNINFITGSNVFLTATNIGSTTHIGFNAFTPVPFINGAVSNYLLTYILPVLAVDTLTVSNLLVAPPNASVQYNSNGIMRGSAGFIYTNGQVRVADIVVAGQGIEVTANGITLNGGPTALLSWTGLGNLRWPSSGVARFEDEFSLNMNRIQLGGDTAAFPAIGRTNGDVIILGANGKFKAGDSTNKLRAPAVFISNDSGMGTPLLRLENPLNAIGWDLAINSNPETFLLGLGPVDENYVMVLERTSGNVGIGITNPTTRLDVQGRFMARSNVYFPNISSNATPVALLATDSNGEVYETAVVTGGGAGVGTLTSTNQQPVLVVVDGDSNSTTDYAGVGFGWGDYLKRKQPWTNFVFTNIAQSFRPASNAVVNFDVRAGSMGILSNSTYHSAVYIGWLGLVDVFFAYPTNEIIASISNNWRLARQAGYSVIGMTIPQSGAAYATNAPDGTSIFTNRTFITTNRWAVNNWIRTHARTNQLYDALVDTEVLLTNGGPRFLDVEGNWYWDIINTNYEASVNDGVHFGPLAQSIIADHIASNVTRWATQPLGIHGGTIRGPAGLTLQDLTGTGHMIAATPAGLLFRTNDTAGGSTTVTNAALTNLVGTAANNVTNVVSLSTSNATSKPLTNSYTGGVLTLFGLEAGANVTVTPNGSNLVIAASSSGGGGAGSMDFNTSQFLTNSLVNIKSGALVTNIAVYGSTNLGHVYFIPDNTYDIGGNGATKPRSIYAANALVADNAIYPTGTGRSFIQSPSDAVLLFANAGGTSFNRAQLGGPTAAFPAIGRNAGDLTVFGADGVAFGSTNRLIVPGGIVLSNTLVSPGKVWTATNAFGAGTWSNAPAGSGGFAAGNSNQIPFINQLETGYQYAGYLSSTNPGFGFSPSGNVGGGYGGLMVFGNTPMGLVTIGHPNAGSDFATFATALVVSNRYNSAADYKNDMVKIDAVMVGGGLRSDSTMTRWRVWQGTTSSNDVAELTIGGVLSLAGGIKVGTNGGTLTNTLYGSATLNFPSTVAGTVSDLPITVLGAADGDIVALGEPSGSIGPLTGVYNAWASNDVVYVRFANNNLATAQDPASGVFKVRVDKFQ